MTGSAGLNTSSAEKGGRSVSLMAKRDELRALFDLADRKGHDVTQSTMPDQ